MISLFLLQTSVFLLDRKTLVYVCDVIRVRVRTQTPAPSPSDTREGDPECLSLGSGRCGAHPHIVLGKLKTLMIVLGKIVLGKLVIVSTRCHSIRRSGLGRSIYWQRLRLFGKRGLVRASMFVCCV